MCELSSISGLFSFIGAISYENSSPIIFCLEKREFFFFFDYFIRNKISVLDRIIPIDEGSRVDLEFLIEAYYYYCWAIIRIIQLLSRWI